MKDFNNIYETLNRNKSKSYYPKKDEWLRTHIKEYFTYDELTKDFNLAFSSSHSKSSVVTRISRLGLTKCKANGYDRQPFTGKENDWIINNFDLYDDIYSLCNAFNKYFDQNRTYKSIRRKIERLKLRRGLHNYTFEQDQWLKENIRKYKSYDDLLPAFNKIFNIHVSRDSLKTHILRKKIKTNSDKTGTEHTKKDFDFDVPGSDKIVREWINNQSNLSLSLRLMIHNYVSDYGSEDLFN